MKSTMLKWLSHLVCVLNMLASETNCLGLSTGPTINIIVMWHWTHSSSLVSLDLYICKMWIILILNP